MTFQCIDCKLYKRGYGPKCWDCIDETCQRECLHPDAMITAHWEHHGDKLISAKGFCRLCGIAVTYCKKARALVPKGTEEAPLVRICEHCGK